MEGAAGPLSPPHEIKTAAEMANAAAIAARETMFRTDVSYSMREYRPDAGTAELWRHGPTGSGDTSASRRRTLSSVKRGKAYAKRATEIP
ncbi:MAG TPA: hypothetical protein VGO85_02290 [Caldimonas sp.]|nr:hypothetical protein [Caldimonas sp.]